MDRNYDTYAKVLRVNESLSARRAWIEIWVRHTAGPRKWVALRKESVDRNNLCLGVASHGKGVALRKESVDRNYGIGNIPLHIVVALRKESVDRNNLCLGVASHGKGRSPQGERG